MNPVGCCKNYGPVMPTPMTGFLESHVQWQCFITSKQLADKVYVTLRVEARLDHNTFTYPKH